MRFNVRNILATVAIQAIIANVWRWLEVQIYGVAETRTVDDVILLLMTPFIYFAVAYIADKQEEKRRQSDKEAELIEGD